MLSITRSARRGGVDDELRVACFGEEGVVDEEVLAGAELMRRRGVVAEEERRALDEFDEGGLGGEGRGWVEVGCVDEAAADAELVEQAGEGGGFQSPSVASVK